LDSLDKKLEKMDERIDDCFEELKEVMYKIIYQMSLQREFHMDSLKQKMIDGSKGLNDEED
jgi:hypothetical protein